MTDTAQHPDNNPASGVRHVVSAEEEKGPYPVDKKYFPSILDTIVRFAKVTEYHMTTGHFLSGCV